MIPSQGARLCRAVFAAAAFLLIAIAPLRASVRAQSAAAGASVPVTAWREVVDETGRTIHIPLKIRRVVSLAPSLTETIYALGLQDRLVGNTDFCDFPEDARKKTKVGSGTNPSIEVLVSLHPDLVLVTKGFNRLETVRALANLGIPSYATDPHNVGEILTSTQRLAGILGASEAAIALTNDLQSRLDAIQRKIAGLPPRRVLFVVWHEPLISVGKDTFIADALRLAGAVSVVESAQDWPHVNLEEVIRLQPEFLVSAASHSETTPRDLNSLATLPGWRSLEAVRNHRYVVISDAVNRPAPRIVSAIEDLARQLHPDAFLDAPEDEKLEKDKLTDPSEKNSPPSSRPGAHGIGTLDGGY